VTVVVALAFPSTASATRLEFACGSPLPGNRKINRVLHIMAVVQLRNPSTGRTYYDRRKANGKTSMEAMRALKRRLSNVVYAHMLADRHRRETASPGGQSGATTDSSATGSTLGQGLA
jgi:hypothetical protein